MKVFAALRTRDAAIALALFVVALSVFLASPIRTLGDSQYSLLLSEQLLTRGSFVLDEHFKPPLDPHLYPGVNGTRGPLPYQIETVGAHQYYFFPIGSSVLSIPFVAVFRIFGVTTIAPGGGYDRGGEHLMQAVMAALLMAALTSVIYATARLLLGRRLSVVVAVVAAFGTQLWSTASRALWSDTWGIFLLGLVVWMLLAHETKHRPLRGWLVASLVAALYIVRPTNAIAVLGVAAYVAMFARGQLLVFLATGAAWLFAFVTYSEVQFARPLPAYYAERWLTFAQFWKPLAAHLVSPSRGFFVFVPVSAFVVFLTVRYRKSLPHARLAVLAYGVIALHLVAISGFSMWYAGVAYGPRYMTGVLPWFVLLAVLGLHAMPPKRHALAAVGLALAALSIVVQSRGGFSPAVWRWNASPPVEVYPDEKIWSLRAPQILAGFVESDLGLPPVYALGSVLRLDAPETDPFLRRGFSKREVGHRWTEGSEAELAFGLDRFEDALELVLTVGAFVSPPQLSRQRVDIELNGEPLATLHLSQGAHRRVVLPLRPGMVMRKNSLVFRLPDARAPSAFGNSTDARVLGIGLSTLVIRAVDPTR